MALSNAQKQARWRERNVAVLTTDAREIASQLIEMEDQAKLKKIAAYINDHLKHPDRDQTERHIALGFMRLSGLNGPLSKTAALAQHREPPQQHSWSVEAVAADGMRWANGVRLGTEEEARVYADRYAYFEIEGYVTGDIIRCDGEQPLNQIMRSQKGARPVLGFTHGTCGSLNWRRVDTPDVTIE
jgi:hypothetical protein